jgi:uncharacterized RmlC-like cupin family protein
MDTTPQCRVVRPGQGYEGKQGIGYATGISAETADSHGLSMHRLELPPGARGLAHLHEHHESAIYVIRGESEVWWGEGLTHHDVVRAGDFVYIPAGVPHLPGNRSSTDPLTAIVARTDANEQESVVLLPELDAVVAAWPGVSRAT